MQGSELYTEIYLVVTIAGWCFTAVLLFGSLMQRTWRQPAWLKCLLSAMAAGLGATVALIPLWIATTVLLMSMRGFGFLLLPLLLVVFIIVACWNSRHPPPDTR